MCKSSQALVYGPSYQRALRLRRDRSQHSGGNGDIMKTRVAVTAALALILCCIAALISCKKSEGPQSTGQVAQNVKY